MVLGTPYPWLGHYPPSVNWHAPLPPQAVTGLLEEAAARYPDNPCLDFLGKKYDYRAVAALADRAARGLQSLGVVKGSRVGLFLPNTPYYVIMYYAILKCGGTVVNFNPLYAEREVAGIIRNSGAEIMVTLNLKQSYDKLAAQFGATPLKRIVVCRMQDVLPPAAGWLFRLFRAREIAAVPRDGRHVPFRELIDNDGRFRPVAIDPSGDIAVLQHTGGTTGTPKAAMLSHANVTAAARQMALWFPGFLPGRERILCLVPLSHGYAMTCCMNFALATGAAMILLPRFEIGQLIRTIRRKRPIAFPAVPTVYAAIARHARLRRSDFSSLRYCISAGTSLPPEVREGFEARTGRALTELYGLSECAGPSAACNREEGIDKPGSIGLPLPGTAIEIVSLEDRKTILPPGEKGELRIRGPQVMPGYWNDAAETAQAFADAPGGRFLYTGDVGYMDGEGYTFIVDRIKDMIAVNGYKVYPRQVQEAVCLHPAVEECLVAGVPDSYHGQTVKAYIKLKKGAGLSEPELLDFLKDKLSKIEIPKLIEFRGQLPKTPAGKPNRGALLEEEAVRRTLRAGGA